MKRAKRRQQQAVILAQSAQSAQVNQGSRKANWLRVICVCQFLSIHCVFVTLPPAEADQQPTVMHVLSQEEQQEGLMSVLRLLLQQLCLDAMPDNAVLCKLLCCSKATSDLVHQTCAGKLAVQLCPPLKDNIARRELSTWLAKHARLLRHLSLDCFYNDVDVFAAAGLRAAAGLPSMRPAAAEPTSSQQVDLDVDPAAQAIPLAEAAAERGLNLMQPPGECSLAQHQPHQPPQHAGVSMLPLLELQLQGRLRGTLLPTISACCKQLTQLQLRPSSGDWLPPLDLTQLTSLRELHIMGGFLCNVPEDTLRIFSSMDQLTKLQASFLGPEAFPYLPASLVDLSAACGVRAVDLEGPTAPVPDLQRLTNLTRLQIGAVQDSQQLPAQLRELHVFRLKCDEGLLQLQQLQSLSLTAIETDASCLAPLTALTHLTALQLRTSKVKGGMSEVCSQLPKLPLLHLWSSEDVYAAQDIEHLGRCTQLTDLQLDAARVGLGVGGFAQQLQSLHNLEHVRLHGVYFAPHPRVPDAVEPLVAALKQLAGRRLSRVRLYDLVLSEEQQSGLRGLLGSGFTYLEGQLYSDSAYSDEEESDGSIPGDWSTDDDAFSSDIGGGGC